MSVIELFDERQKLNMDRDPRSIEPGSKWLSLIAMYLSILAYAVSSEDPYGNALSTFVFLFSFKGIWSKGHSLKPFSHTILSIIFVLGVGAVMHWAVNDGGHTVFIFAMSIGAYGICHYMQTKQDGAKMFAPIMICNSLALLQSENVFTGLLCIFAIGLNLIGMSWAAQNLTHKSGVLKATWTVAKVSLMAIPISVAIFFLFPRVPLGFNENQGDKDSGTTGMSQTMTPGSVSELVKDRKIAFTVDFRSEIPAGDSLFWKAGVLDRFNGKTWSSDDYTKRISEETQPPDIKDIPSSFTWDYEMRLPASMMDFVPVLDSAIPGNMAVNMGMPGSYMVGPDPSGVYTKQNFDGYSITARVKMATPASFAKDRGSRPFESYLSSPRPQDISLPSDSNPRTRELAHQWANEAKQSGEGVNHVVNQFQRLINEGPYLYTLKPKRWGSDGFDQLLFEDKAGFCEHYASTLVFLLRAAGFPARVAVGYQGAEIEGLTARVLSQNAHAWTEVWFEGKGWRRVDPTSFIHPSRIEKDTQDSRSEKSSMLMRMSAWSESASGYWNESIVFYDAMRQKDILSRLFGDPIERAKRLAVLAAAGLIMFLLWKKMQRVLRSRRPIHQQSEAVYGALIASAKKLDVDVNARLTPGELIQALEAQRPQEAKKAHQTLDLIGKIKAYEVSRYGR